MAPLGKEQWKAIEPLLDEALELDGAARAAWLDALAERSPALASDVATLLRGDLSRGDDWLEVSPLSDAPGRLADVGSGALAGQTIGAYTLVRPIGDGGMGSVWLGRRSDGRFEGEVAIKLLHRSLIGRSGEQRFAQEGQVLARLTHPHIARLLDAGVSDGGQPYLVLEYVNGERIDRSLKTRQVAPADRLRLFLDLLSAVSSAHAQLILHRDIKPSNILVSSDGTATLLDFGIAKLMDDGRGLADQSTLTEAFGQAFTPEYAAPEQLRNEPVSMATDVYALGVVLYALLTGRHPTSEGCTTDAERREAALTREPVRLSRRIGALVAERPEDAARIAAERGSTPAMLRGMYAGDLDNILAKALQKDAPDRYQSVQAFADDLTAYLTDRPVSAQAESRAYRARKFVRRNRTAVMVGAAVFVALLGASVVTTRQMFEAQRQRDAAAFEARYAQATNEFMNAVLTDFGPDEAPVPLVTLLDRARDAVLTQTTADPRLSARLMFALSEQYVRADRIAESRALLRRADSLASDVDDPELRAMILCRRADGVGRSVDSAEAYGLLHDGQKQLARARTPALRTRAQCALAEADLLLSVNHATQLTVDTLRRLTAELRGAGQEDSQLYLDALDRLAIALGFARRPREAIEVQREISQSLERQGRGRNVLMSASLVKEANYLHEIDESVTELDVMRRVVEIQRAARAVGSRQLWADRNYGNVLNLQAQYDSADIYLRRFMITADSLGDLTASLDARRSLVRNLLKQERFTEARQRIAEMEAIVPTITTANMRGAVIIAKAQLGVAEGNPTRGLPELDSLLRVKGYPAKTTFMNAGQYIVNFASATYSARRYAAADTSARAVLRFATFDSLSHLRSAAWGVAMLRLSQIALAVGDTALGRARLDSSIAPLRFGHGDAHPRYREAIALRDSLRR